MYQDPEAESRVLRAIPSLTIFELPGMAVLLKTGRFSNHHQAILSAWEKHCAGLNEHDYNVGEFMKRNHSSFGGPG